MNQYSAQVFETSNSTVKLNRSLKQFHGITKPLSLFFDFFHIIYFKTKSDLKIFYQKIFDKLLIFAKTKKQGKHKSLLTGL